MAQPSVYRMVEQCSYLLRHLPCIFVVFSLPLLLRIVVVHCFSYPKRTGIIFSTAYRDTHPKHRLQYGDSVLLISVAERKACLSTVAKKTRASQNKTAEASKRSWFSLVLAWHKVQ